MKDNPRNISMEEYTMHTTEAGSEARKAICDMASARFGDREGRFVVKFLISSLVSALIHTIFETFDAETGIKIMEDMVISAKQNKRLYEDLKNHER